MGDSPEFIPLESFHSGQAEERDRLLAALLIEKGVLTSEEAHDFRRECAPGDLGDFLVRRARLSPQLLDQFSRECEKREILEVAGEGPLPPEVEIASRDTRVRVGRYLLIRCVGKGGMGEVWKAWDGQLRRWAALKFLKSDDLPMLQRLAREANLASRLSHPAIPRIYEIVTHGSRPFIAMEFVEGNSLEGRRYERKRAAAIIRDAARAVQHAHESGVVHRDLKPANLMEGKDGKVVVTDFGLARPIEGGGTLTESGATLGTPSYMAPEQVRGKPVTARTDVYELGATLYALIEGRPPFVGSNNYEIFQRILSGPSPRLSEKDDLEPIVAMATQHESADRYRSAGDLAEDLDRYLNGESIRARPVPTAIRIFRRIRRRPFVSAIIAGAAAVGLAATVVVVRAEKKRKETERRQRAEAGVVQAQRFLTEIRDMQRWGVPREGDAFQGAVRSYAQAIEPVLYESPDHAPALYHLAVLHYLRREHRESIEVCGRLLEADPNQHDVRAVRAVARWEDVEALPIRGIIDLAGFRVEYAPYPPEVQKELGAASRDFALLPEKHDLREFGEGVTALSLGRFDRSREILERIVEKRGWPPEAYTYLAIAEIMTGAPDKAHRHASEALKRGMGAPVLNHEARAYAAAMQGQWDEAIRDAALALESRPSGRALRRFRAAWLTHAGRHSEALAEYDRILGEGPREANDLMNRSIALRALEKYDEAILAAREAAQLDPQDYRIHYHLGLNYEKRAYRHLESRDQDKALLDLQASETEYSAAIERKDDFAYSYQRRGRVRMMMMRFREALEDFERAVALHHEIEKEVADLMEECRKRIRD